MLSLVWLDIDESSETTHTIQGILEKVFNDINSEGRAVVVHENNSLHLSGISLAAEPPQVIGGWMVGWLVGWLDGWLVGCSLACLIGCVVGWLVGNTAILFAKKNFIRFALEN